MLSSLRFGLLLIVLISKPIKCSEEEGEFCYRKEDCENDLHLFATNVSLFVDFEFQIFLNNLLSHLPKELNGHRYLLYDVRREKSLSVRRNVYINMARLVQSLGTNWTLVLPTWDLYVPRWKEHNEASNKINWSDFFKVEILRELIPVIDFNDFLEHVSNELDLVLVLNRFGGEPFDDLYESAEPTTNRYELSDENCKHIQFYEKDQHIYGLFFGYKDHMKAKRMTCMALNGGNGLIEQALAGELSGVHSLFVQNADLLTQPGQTDRTYWLFRRSIQLSDAVMTRANKFRRKQFDSDDEKDKTWISSDWKLEKLNRQKQSDVAIGGGYIAVHWPCVGQWMDDRPDDRTDADALRNEANAGAPKLEAARVAKQILIGLKGAGLTLAFVATDANDLQWTELSNQFKRQLEAESRSADKYKLHRYKNRSNKLPAIELELIEQWICAHSRLFIGAPHSTYSRLVREQREILGFNSSSTFNVLCEEEPSEADPSLCKVAESKIKY